MADVLHYGEIPFLYAEQAFLPGDTILSLGNVVTSEFDPRRLQVSADVFLLPPRLLRHSCDPNGFVDWTAQSLVAAKGITRGDVVSYHYGTSELDYTIGQFRCQCGSSRCLGEFRGFRYMEPRQQVELYDRASPYIRGYVASRWL